MTSFLDYSTHIIYKTYRTTYELVMIMYFIYTTIYRMYRATSFEDGASTTCLE